jgi:CHAT domain
MKSKKIQTPTELYVSKRRLSPLKKLVYYFGIMVNVAGVVIAINGFLLFGNFVLSFIGAIFNSMSSPILPNEEIFKTIKPFKNVTDGFFSMVIGGAISGTGIFLQSLVQKTQNRLGTNIIHNDNRTNHRNINIGDGNYNEQIEGNYVQGDYREGKQSHFNLQGTQFAGGLVDADTVNAHQIGGNIYNSEQKQNLEQVKTILILVANPKTTTALRLDEEIREIDAGLQRAKKRELFDLKQRWAVRVQDVYQSLLDFKPQIVHFSGHGTGDDGLALEDEAGNVRLVDTVALAKLFELFAADIECVVLNACYSEVQAEAIVQHIPYVIGMNKAIGDIAAIKFSTGFYSALGAGESVEFAYKLGCNVIQLDGIAEHLTPVLKKKQ